jgi:hypothetical protein
VVSRGTERVAAFGRWPRYRRTVIDPRAPAVAARAAELALDRGIELSDDLELWRLAGGRPPVTASPGDPRELGGILEGGHHPAQRRRRGAHYTPASIAGPLVARALHGHDGPLVADPACGGGALLLEAADQLLSRGASAADVVTCLYGADVDPLAVATTEAALWLWAGVPAPVGHLVVADAVLDDLGWPPLDVIVGNPPFLSQLAADTAREPVLASEVRDRFGSAAGAYTDTAALFLLRSLELVGADASIVLLQPLSVLGARDAAPVRSAVGERAAVEEVWVPPSGAFAAAVDVCAPVIRMGRPSGGAPAWSAHLSRAAGVPCVELRSNGRLGDEATTTAGFRTEFYGLAAHVHEQVDLPEGRRLVTTGLVDLGHCAWGERSARIAGRRWERPVVDVHALAGRAASWVERTGHPKLIVATQTRVVEVVIDAAGELVPGVPLIAVLGPVERLPALAAALAAPAVTAWALHQVAGTALSATALKVTAGLVRQVPLPADGAAWVEGTEAFRRHDLEAFVDAMAAAYAVGPEVGEWWVERARSVWSPAPVPR